MALPVPVATPYRIYLTVFHGAAMITTVFRLTFRHRMLRLWWDDYFAASTLVFDILYFATLWIPVNSADHPAPLGHKALAIVYWSMAVLFTFTVWSARISIACSIIRILPPRSTMRRFTTGVAFLFGLIWIGLFIQKFWSCGKFLRLGRLCHHVMPAIGIAQLSADVLSDTLLIGIPIRTLWRTKLQSSQRILIISIFATSIVVTCFSVAQNIFILEDNIFLLVITAHLEAASSLIVCNLLVVVTFIYRMLRNGEELEGTTTTEDPPSGPRPTTVSTGTNAPLTTLSFTDASGWQTDPSSIQTDSGTKICHSFNGSDSNAAESSSGKC